MALNVLYFASLREALGRDGEQLERPSGVHTVGELRAWLLRRGGEWEVFAPGRNVRAALNQTMVGADTALGEHDEVAFFPPVTGG